MWVLFGPSGLEESKPPSRSSQVQLDDKTNAGQSLSVAFSASSTHLDRDPLRTWAVVNLSSPLAPMNSRTGERALSNRSQSMTNEFLADETRAFRPENGN